MLKRTVMLLCALMFSANLFAYEVHLKNGKLIRGKLISETDQILVVEDEGGLRMNLKKSSVDLEKTTAANQVTEAAPAQPAEPEVTAEPAKPSKKPARVLTEADIARVREKYSNMGEGEEFTEAESEGQSNSSARGKSGEQWQQDLNALRERARSAEAMYQNLQQSCDELQGLTVQQHILTDEKNNPLNIAETREDVCAKARAAKTQFNEARSQYLAAEQAAKEDGAAPGYTRSEDEYEETLREDESD